MDFEAHFLIKIFLIKKLVQFEYAEFDGVVHFFCFGPNILFSDKFGPKMFKMLKMY